MAIQRTWGVRKPLGDHRHAAQSTSHPLAKSFSCYDFNHDVVPSDLSLDVPPGNGIGMSPGVCRWLSSARAEPVMG